MGYRVLVVEEDHEVGTPEKCTGIVYTRGLRTVGLLEDKLVSVRAETGTVSVEGRGTISVKLRNLGVVVLNRREFDRELARKAYASGAEIRVATKAVEFRRIDNQYLVVTNRGKFTCRLVVDARGFSSYLTKNRKGLLHSVQLDCFCKTTDNLGDINVIIDKAYSKEYFFWVVKTGEDSLKIGGAGSSARLVDTKVNEIAKRFSCVAYKRVSSPIVVGGPRIDCNYPLVPVGDAAGQSKPTTGGGIITGILSGQLLATIAARHLEKGPVNVSRLITDYVNEWSNKYGREMKHQALLRDVYSRLSNNSVWRALKYAEASGILEKLSGSMDFDWHAKSLVFHLTPVLV
jgi:flavin-dependent dehydrogenase